MDNTAEDQREILLQHFIAIRADKDKDNQAVMVDEVVEVNEPLVISMIQPRVHHHY